MNSAIGEKGRPQQWSSFQSALKRGFDVFVSLLGLVVLAPLFAAIAVAVGVSTGRPVLFSQKRPGLGGRSFCLYKFRTMSDRRDAGGRLLADEVRLTRVGRFLRSTSLDELPELWNVLRGEMSLVGPRPLLTDYLQYYTPEEARRHDVRPGITGWAQIHGRNALSWEEKFQLDVWYVDNWNLWLDAKILARTAWMVLKREGISAAGHATMPAFSRQVDSERVMQVDRSVASEQKERAECGERHA